MHLPDFANVITQRCGFEFVSAQDRPRFLECPGKVVAVVVQGIIGVLRAVEAAVFLVGKPFIHPADDVFCHRREGFIAGYLVTMGIIFQQLGVVIRHFFKVRHHPVLVHGVAMKASGQMVIDAALRHLFQCDAHHIEQRGACFFRLSFHRALQQQVDGAGMRKLGRGAKATVLRIKQLHCRFHNAVHQFRTQRS